MKTYFKRDKVFLCFSLIFIMIYFIVDKMGFHGLSQLHWALMMPIPIVAAVVFCEVFKID
ncbi:MAG: hypothetical protein Q7S87_08240 [Agitococcus sp.]|nr:hypothetical protein [Moraxellaceae bacterium]MDO8416183.1 hypothetical protein [Agitococcus sp.]TQC97062.1 hypothetical protein FK216_10860 [Moraxellaceae bacterium AER2_44_116]